MPDSVTLQQSHVDSLLADGFYLIPISPGKIPLVQNWNTEDPKVQLTPGYRYGIVPPPDIIIIDIDIKNGARGLQSWELFCADHPTIESRIRDNLAVHHNTQTGSGGYHVFMKLDNVDYKQIPKMHPRYPGIDFLTHGKCYAVAGGQQLDNGFYTLNTLTIYGKITPSTPLLDQRPYPADENALQGAKKRTQSLSAPAIPGNTAYQQAQTLLTYLSSDDYNLWYKVAFVLMSLPLQPSEAKALFHEWSSTSSKYNAYTCEEKWHKLAAAYDPTKDTLSLGSLVYHATQQNPDKVNEIYAIIHENTDTLVGIYCDVQSWKGRDHYFHIPTHARHAESLVKATLKPLLDKLSAERKTKVKIQDLVNEGIIYSPVGEVYAPGQAYPLFTNNKGAQYINTCDPADVPQPQEYTDSRQVDFVIQHATQIFGKKYVHDFLSFVAYLVQNPGKKMRWMLVLQGGHGVGKGLLINIIKTHVLGAKNCGIASSEQMKSKYTAWAFGKQLIHIDELLITGRDSKQAIETLKTLISEDTAVCEQKHVAATEVPHYGSFIALTNHTGCIKYADSRRYHCIRSPIVSPADLDLGDYETTDDYFDYLGSIASRDNSRGGELRYFFENYEIPAGFSANIRPKTSDFDAFKETSAMTAETEDFIELIKYVAGTATLPPFVSLQELVNKSTHKNPHTEGQFYDEPLKNRDAKNLAKKLEYSAYAGWLFTNEIHPEKAQARIKKFNAPVKLTTVQALQHATVTTDTETLIPAVVETLSNDPRPAYICVQEIVDAVISNDPVGVTESSVRKKIKKYAAEHGYALHGGWLYSTQIDPITANKAILRFTELQQKVHKQHPGTLYTTQQALNYLKCTGYA